MMFGNRSVTIHLARGAIGFGAFALLLSGIGWGWTLVLVPVALLALKGCPICWTIGLFETVAARIHKRVDTAAS